MTADLHQADSETLARLSELFGAQKAEWLGPRLFELFSEPSYFPRMTTPRPCILVGGRGTGKTTVLRGMSYQGQFELDNRDAERVPDWPYYGLYWRVATNKVAAFKGPELSESQWIQYFGHYINLLMCVQVLRFLSWFQETTEISTDLDEDELEMVAASFGLTAPKSNMHLLQLLQRSLIGFEAHINNVADSTSPALSMQGAPMSLLIEFVKRQEIFAGKLFFFLVDEYENFEDYQQRLMNTLIKHSGELYSFKVCVRELGWRVRNTLAENEYLISPADYSRIDINEMLQGPPFEEFSHKVCQDRLAVLAQGNHAVMAEIRDLLPSITEEEEARLLGIDEHNREILRELREIGPTDIVENFSPMEIYLLGFWGRSHNQSLREVFEDYKSNPRSWRGRLNNYSHALLFTLHRGRPGIRKYYAGWDTFIQLSGGNIRFLLQLVEASFARHLREGHSLNEPLSPAMQTNAAQTIGRANLTELEGMSVRGAQLTKLLLGLGRIFGIMAGSLEGHAPEVNQFEVVDTPGTTTRRDESSELLDAAVMHLALERHSGSKLASEGDIRDWDYMIYPIFAPFFNFSYRRKRKMNLTPDHLLDLVDFSSRAIRRILAATNRSPDEPLPEQLRLFEMFYAQPN